MKLIILCFFLTIMSPQVSMANPFDGIRESKKVQTVIKSPNILNKIWFKFIKHQKTLNEKITSNIKEVKAGNSLAFWTVIMFAFLYGVIHAIGPGHGKLLIISYFTSHKNQWWKGVLMGFQIAFMHIISAIILVSLTDGIAKQAFGNSPSKEMLTIKLISYFSIALIGFIMVVKTYKHKKDIQKNKNYNSKQNKSQWLLSISIGLVPCTGALLFLFYTMSQEMLFTGICIVLSMGMGIAISLSLIGITCILTRKNISKLNKTNSVIHKYYKYLSCFGYLLILIIGLSMFIKEIYKLI